METFKKGDILWGEKREFTEAWHPVVYISGPGDAPLAVVLTHDGSFPCNIPLVGKYDGEQSYFVAHLIQKMSEWKPYKKSNRLELNEDDLKLIESHIANQPSITWEQYQGYSKKGRDCHDHQNR